MPTPLCMECQHLTSTNYSLLKIRVVLPSLRHLSYYYYYYYYAMTPVNARQPMTSYSHLALAMARSHLVFKILRKFFGLGDVLATSGIHTATLSCGFDFKHGVSC